MRHRSLIRLLAAGVAVATAGMGLAACGGSSQATTDANGKPIVKISMRRNIANGKIKDTVWAKQLEAACDCTIEWSEIADNAWDQQKSAKMAAGDFPDISMRMFEPADVNRYSSSFEDLKPHLKQMPNVEAFFKASPTAKKMANDDKNHVYILPSDRGKGYRVSATHMFINKQWLDKLGLPMPTTWGELENVLEAFKTKDPNGNGKADEVPMNIRGLSFGLWSPLVLLNSTGITTTCADGSAFSQGYYAENGKVKTWLTSNNLKRVITYLHRLLDEGLIPKDTLTRDGSQYDAQTISDGKTALTGVSVGWSTQSEYGRLSSQYVPLPVLKETSSMPTKNLKTDYSQDTTEYNYTLAVSSKAANKDAIYKIINAMYSEKSSVQQYYADIPEYLSSDGNHTYTVSNKVYEKYVDTHEISAQDRFAGWIPDNVTIKNDTNADQIGQTDKAYKSVLSNVDPVKDTIPIYVRPDGKDMDTLSNNNTAIFNYANNQLAKWVQHGGVDGEWSDYVKKVEDPSLGLQKNVQIWQRYYDKYTK